MKTAREYVKGAVPIDVCLKRSPSLSLVDAIVTHSLHVSGDGCDEVRALRRDAERPLIHRPLATRYVGPHPEASADRLVVRFVTSSGAEARDDKELMLEGVDWAGYDLNPVWLFAHDWDGLPIGRCLARRIYRRASGSYELHQDIEFTPEDVYPFGHQVGTMHVRGFLRACSGGWMGTRVRIIRGADGKPERIIYLNADWMETSSCAVGLDKYAVQEAVLRGVLKRDAVDQFARAARIAATSAAYEIREEPTMSIATRAGKAPRDRDERTLIEEKVMSNVIEEWDASEAAIAARSASGDGDGGKPADATPEGEAEEATPEGEATPPADGGGGGEEQQPAEDAGDGGGAAGEGAGDAATAAGDAADEHDPAVVRAALAVLRNFVKRSPGEAVATRGAVSAAMDSAVDELFANVMVLAQCAEELRWCSSDVFFEGRSAKAEVERAVRARMNEVSERVVRMISGMPPTTDDRIERAVARAESALSRVSNALSEVRDSVSLFGADAEAEASAPIAQRSGRKIARARRQNLKAALDGVRSAMERLQSVLDEEPDPDEEKEDAEEEGKTAIATDDEADAAVARAFLSRASGVLARRGLAEPTTGESADAAIDEEPNVAEIASRAAELDARLAGLIERRGAGAAPEKETPAAPAAAPTSVRERARALEARAARLPGVMLPRRTA